MTSKLRASGEEIQQLHSKNAHIGQIWQSVVDYIEQTDQYGPVLQSLINRMGNLADSDSIAVSSPSRPSTQPVDNTSTLVTQLQSMIDQSRKTKCKICVGKCTGAVDQSPAGKTDTETISSRQLRRPIHGRRNGFESGTAEGVEHEPPEVVTFFFRNLRANWCILERKSLSKLLGQIQINIAFITTSVRLNLMVHNLFLVRADSHRQNLIS